MKEHGCGRTMADGQPCTTADESEPPMLCEDCLAELVASLEMAEMYVNYYERAWADAARRAKMLAAANVILMIALLCNAIIDVLITLSN